MEKMYLIFNSKSPFYQVLYKKNGKKTTVSAGTADRQLAEKFLQSFNPFDNDKPPARSISIKLSSFIKEYKNYVNNNFSVKYLKKAVNPSLNVFQKYCPICCLKISLQRLLTSLFHQQLQSLNIPLHYITALSRQLLIRQSLGNTLRKSV